MTPDHFMSLLTPSQKAYLTLSELHLMEQDLQKRLWQGHWVGLAEITEIQRLRNEASILIHRRSIGENVNARLWLMKSEKQLMEEQRS